MRRVTVSFPWPLSPAATREIFSFSFTTALVTYLLLYLVESLSPGAVSRYYNLDHFLWVTIILGVISSFWPATVQNAREDSKPDWKDYLWIVVLALGSGAVIYSKSQDLGLMAKIIAPLGALIVFGMALLVYFDRSEDSS